MIRTFLPCKRRPDRAAAADLKCQPGAQSRTFRRGGSVALAVLLGAAAAAAQVMTIDTSGKGPLTVNSPVDRRYAQIEPTHVKLPSQPLDAKTRLELIRAMQMEPGFAMRPLPRGHKGLTLTANGKLEPAGDAYMDMVASEGLSVKPGGRVVVTDMRVEHGKMVFDLNGGPDLKHRLLRHVQIGAGPNMTGPVLPDSGELPGGSRLTLVFKERVPELTAGDVKALLAPLLSFDVKTPIQAFTDTLPTQLKEAILNHRVLVGMSTDMVLFAKGQPLNKVREMDGQMPFEEWIYGKPPQDVEFVRINGNRVIRLEVAKMGAPPAVFTEDVVSGMMRTDGTPVVTAQKGHVVREGDVERDPDREAPAAPPTLRNPGESLPDNASHGVGEMRPVQPAKPHQPPLPGTNPVDQPPASAPAAPNTPAAPVGNGQTGPG